MDRAAYYQARMEKVTILNQAAQHIEFVPGRIRTSIEYSQKLNRYIMLSVSVLMDIPLTSIPDKHRPTSCDARMVCFFLLRKHCFLSFRKIAHLYGVDYKQVFNRIKAFESFIRSRTYPDLVTVADAISHCIEENQKI